MNTFLYQDLGDSLGVLGIIIACALPLLFVALFALVAVYAERKISAFMQDRLGPMEVGPWGLLQTIADILKLITKEIILPTPADKFLFFLAPLLVFMASYAGFAALPFSSKYIGANLNIGIFYIISITSLEVVGILMAGWGSNNKWSLYGAVRSAAQIVSYEIPAGLAVLAAVMMAGTMDMNKIVELQAGGIHHWFFVRTFPFSFIAMVIFFIASLAETNRAPFDIPEAESELVAGFHTEYGGMNFAFLFLAEYANMFLVSAVLSTLFLGGWNSPFPGGIMDGPIWGLFWILSKGCFFVFVQMWLRWTLPRLRVDQLMYLCWKVLTPFALVCVMATAVYELYLLPLLK
jgi:NADH-quinone oxidoreductase subunit H